MASEQGRSKRCSSTEKSPRLSENMTASVDRLSQPKHKAVPHAMQGKRSNQQRLKKSREGSELTGAAGRRSYAEPLHKTSNSQLELRTERPVSYACQLEDVPALRTTLPPPETTNLSRELAASVERLSRPRSRKEAMHQNRLSLNLDEQWKSLEQAFQSNLQQVSSPAKSDFGASTASSSRESICSQSTNRSFGSRSSLFGSHSFNQSGRPLENLEKQRGNNLEVEPSFGRRKARSERLLASMDSLNFSTNGRGLSGSKSLSPNAPTRLSISKSRTVSEDRLASVSRLLSPTVSSTLKHRVASETKLNRTPSNLSLSSKSAKDAKKQSKSTKRISTLRKKSKDVIVDKIKALAGRVFH